MSNQALPIAEITASPLPPVVPPTLALAGYGGPTRRVQSRRPRMLVISEERVWAQEVRALVPTEAVEVEFRPATEFAHRSPQELAESAEILVVVGIPLELGTLTDKPVVWLPAPRGSIARHDAFSSWRKHAEIALQAAVAPMTDSEASEPNESCAAEAPTLDATTGELHQGERSVRVTPTECNLLRVLLAHRGHWIPASELRLRAFGPGHACHDSLIRVHVYKLRRKLACMSAQIRSAKGRGYMLA